MANILIVEGQKNERDYLGGLLESAGHRVDLVANTRKAIDRLDAAEFDVVVLSSKIGKNKGIEMLPSIRRRSPHTQVVLTGKTASANTAIDALRYGAFDYLVKPIDPIEFTQVVAGAAGAGAVGSESRSLEEGNLKYQQHLEQRIESLTNELGKLRKFASFAESACDYFLEIDDQGRVVKSNQQTDELFGFGSRSAGSTSLKDSLNLNNISLIKLVNIIDMVSMENRPAKETFRFFSVNGETFDVRFQIFLRPNEDGSKVIALLGREVSPEPEKAERLNEENRCLARINQINEQMLSQLSYEIRTHLVPIKGYMELLVRGSTDWSSAKGMLEKTLISVKRLENVAHVMQPPRVRDLQAENRTS